MSVEPELLHLDNHGKVRRVLSTFASRATLARFDDAVANVVKQWYLLARRHLRVARRLVRPPRDWRSAVSRTYYAAYNASRAVRYRVNGRVKPGAEDHKEVGDLPNDFPNRDQWSSFLDDLRYDRNVSDYEPWPAARQRLKGEPADSLIEVERFIRDARGYLRDRGVIL